jgi:hypothetical protein
MDTPLPSNETLLAYSKDIAWQRIEQQRRLFNQTYAQLSQTQTEDVLPLPALSTAIGSEVSALYDTDDSDAGTSSSPARMDDSSSWAASSARVTVAVKRNSKVSSPTT